MASTAAHILLLLLLLSLYVISASSTTRHRRHLLHQPFFPPTTTVPPSQPPALSPQPQTQPPTQPKYPFSSTTTPNYPQNQKPFFPTFPSPPPPPSVSSLATFPANISSLLFPHPPSSPSHRHLIITISVSVSLLFAASLAALSAFFLHSRHHQRRLHTTTSDKTSLPDNVRLFPPDTVHSDGSPKLPKLSPRPGVPNTSSEFLYLGTLVNSRAGVDDHHQHHNKSTVSGNATVKIGVSSSPYQKLGSPELKPLPPLPKHNYTPSYRSGEVLIGSFNKEDEAESDTEEEEFFSPRGSSGRKEIPQGSPAAAVGMGMGLGIGSSSRREFQGENLGSRSFNSRTASYPYSNSCSPSNSISTTPSPVSNASPQSTKTKSPDTIVAFPVPVQSAKHSSSSISSSSSSSPKNAHISPERNLGSLGQYVPVKLPPPPPPPPLPPPRFWEMPAGVRVGPEASFGGSGPPVLVMPSGRVLVQNEIPIPTLSGEQEQLQKSGSGEKSEETPKPRLKPLHWDKVRASSDRAMVWDQIKTSSFQ